MTTELLALLTRALQEPVGSSVLTAVLVFFVVGAVKLLLKGIWRTITDIRDCPRFC